MPKPCLPQRKRPTRPGGGVAHLRAVTLLMVCAAYLGGCAGSSGSTAADSGSSSYNADGSVGAASTSSSYSTSFTPTAAAAHSAAAGQAADKLTSVATPGNMAYEIRPVGVLGGAR